MYLRLHALIENPHLRSDPGNLSVAAEDSGKDSRSSECVFRDCKSSAIKAFQ
jgi:hypothetical protein